MAAEFGALGFAGRLAFALALVLLTYNPAGFSYANWALETGFDAAVALAGVALLIAWVVYLRATFLALGWFGIVLGTALFSCMVWLLVDIGWLDLDSPHVMGWIGLVMLAILLAVGMSWSHIRRRLTGQFDVDEVDD